MTEALFQFIWQHSLYLPAGLMTVAGDRLTVIHPGKRNTNAGPDFLEARIKIGTTLLVGNIELHIRTSDWLRHGHQRDAAYSNLILHVVFEDDMPPVNDKIPVLQLKPAIATNTIAHYHGLMDNLNKIPCNTGHFQVKELTKEAWLSRLLAERWEQKLGDWQVMLTQSAEDWRNLLYWRMAANFGFKTNAAPFLMLARSLPLNVLARHREQIKQVEALLFGQAGMLSGTPNDDYQAELQAEYKFLAQKYQLTPIAPHLWKFLRMRPANFPTIRLAQFAALIYQSEHLFSQIIEKHSFSDIAPLLDVTATEYWHHHFVFGEMQQQASPKSLGKDSINNIIINTIAPIQFLYATRQGTQDLQEQALALLESVPSENNNIINLWKAYDWVPTNAAQTQALIQLYNEYCSKKRCLDCAIGLSIMKAS